jgi:hypothetical protein
LTKTAAAPESQPIDRRAMDRIRHFADISIRRGCGFGFIAIGTAMVGMAWDVPLAIKSGAVLVSFMAGFLWWKSYQAPTRDYRDTEVFLLMERRHEFPEARAQQVFGNVLRECYLRHATYIAALAVVLWAIYFVLWLAR